MKLLIWVSQLTFLYCCRISLPVDEQMLPWGDSWVSLFYVRIICPQGRLIPFSSYSSMPQFAVVERGQFWSTGSITQESSQKKGGVVWGNVQGMLSPYVFKANALMTTWEVQWIFIIFIGEGHCP